MREDGDVAPDAAGSAEEAEKAGRSGAMLLES
jgi:hypothetical protein